MKTQKTDVENNNDIPTLFSPAPHPYVFFFSCLTLHIYLQACPEFSGSLWRLPPLARPHDTSPVSVASTPFFKFMLLAFSW